MLKMLKALRRAHDREDGQMAFFMVLMLLVVFMFFAMSLDAGFWYFDHRTAQNQAEAAALAGVQELPNASGAAALASANTWLGRNGSSSSQRYATGEGSPNPKDTNGDGELDTLRICVRRSSGVFFSALANITDVKVSACATAKVGRVDFPSVLPWYVAAPDPTCSRAAARQCKVDYNYDGDILDLNERLCDFSLCPYGLDLNAVWKFKADAGANSGAIEACGNGATKYVDCIVGHDSSGNPVVSAPGFFQVGSTIQVQAKSGNLGGNTAKALDDRYAGTNAGGNACDVAISPAVPPGAAAKAFVGAYDPAGKTRATARFVTLPPNPDCPLRLITVPIFDRNLANSPGNQTVVVVGIATFGIANWPNPTNKSFAAPSGSDCQEYSGPVPNSQFDCGMVWGYMFTDVRPPNVLLEKIGSGNNPFAPLLAALID